MSSFPGKIIIIMIIILFDIFVDSGRVGTTNFLTLKQIKIHHIFHY